MFQATHLIVFLPPCLGAFVLSNHSSHNSAFFKFSSPDAPTNEGPTACVKQVANFPLPSLLPNQSVTPSLEPEQRRRKVTSLPLPSLYLLNLKHLFNQRDLIGFYAFPCHPPILFPTDASPPLHPTTMAPAHLKPLTLLFVTLPIFHTMTHFLHTLTQLLFCNSRTRP